MKSLSNDGIGAERALIEASGLFDADWYAERYSDVELLDMDPLSHFMTYGRVLGRDPSPGFSATEYLRRNPDVARKRLDALTHYCKQGRGEGRAIYPVDGGQSGLLSEPRFGGREYGPVEMVMAYDGVVGDAGPHQRLCVHLHLFHAVLAETCLAYLRHIPCDFTLLVSVQQGESEQDWQAWFLERLGRCVRCSVLSGENRGRDIMPMFGVFKDEVLEHDIVLHFHTKTSSYSSEYRDWRTFLLHNTLGSAAVVASILSRFATDPSAGIVVPPYFHALKAQPNWGANKARTNAVLTALGFGEETGAACPDFPAGSFFWARVAAIRPLLDEVLKDDAFEEECGQIDGTLAHAIERLLGIVPRRLGYRVVCAGTDIGYNLKNYWTQRRMDRVLGRTLRAPASDRLARDLPEALRGLSIAVCTCVTGGIDELASPPLVEKGVDYFCFTDREVGISGAFQLRRSRYLDVNPRRTARYVKTHPHVLLPEYDVVVWIDANVVPMHGIGALVQSVLHSDAVLGMVTHPLRASYVDEAKECARIGADDAGLLLAQAEHYLSRGIIDDGLIETNVMVSFPKRPEVRRFFATWWREICGHSLRDQVSVNMALQESGVRHHLIFDEGVSARDHDGFVMFAHSVKGKQRVIDHIAHGGRS